MNKIYISILSILALTYVIACNNNSAKNDAKAFDTTTMDKQVKPGDDFFQYANGTWIKNTPIPDEHSYYGSFTILYEENLKQLHDLFEEASNDKNATEGSNKKKIGDFYASGMDSTKIENDGYKPLENELKNIENIKNTEEFQNLVAKYHTMGITSLFATFDGQDDKNSSMVIAHVNQDGIGLPDRDYYFPNNDFGKNILAKYELHVTKMFQLIGEDEAKAKESAKKVISIETDLAKSSMTLLEQRDPNATYNKISVDELSKICPSFNWNNYFATIGLKDLKEINVRQPNFFKNLNNLLTKVSIEDWKTYLRWHLLNNTASYLSSAFVNERFDFYGRTLSGSKKMSDRWKKVLNNANFCLGEAIGQVYVEKHFPPQAKERMLKLVDNLKIAFEQHINKLDWMVDSTKQKAVAKLKTINVKIGYPDKWIDYADLKIDRNNYLQNVLEGSKFNFKRSMAKINKPVDRTEWGMTPQTVNAYYSPNMNEIVFPAAILQPPFFFLNGDEAMNYGAIGAVIGHEMTHGFDDQGRLFDKDGNLTDWWSKEDAEKFNAKTKVLVEQFNKFFIKDSVHVDGELTLGENIADLGGLSIAYTAFKNATKDKKIEPIDGFTQEQRFFLAWSQVWRSNIREEELLRRIKEDVHSPAKYRINGIFYNMPEFYEAYNISPNDALFKAINDRAKIW